MNIKKAYEELINEVDCDKIKRKLSILLEKYGPNNLHALASTLYFLSYCEKSEENIIIFDKIKDILFKNKILPLPFMKGIKMGYDKYSSKLGEDSENFQKILSSINRFYNRDEHRNEITIISKNNRMRSISIPTEVIEEYEDSNIF